MGKWFLIFIPCNPLPPEIDGKPVEKDCQKNDGESAKRDYRKIRMKRYRAEKMLACEKKADWSFLEKNFCGMIRWYFMENVFRVSEMCERRSFRCEVEDNMDRQKRVAVINDVTGFGRCSAAVAQPIISAMKIQCCVVPTAILSVHTGFPDYTLQDFTPYLKEYMDSWEKTGIHFDGISSGFIGSKEQIALVIDFFERFKKEDTLTVVDPVMGDYGKLYSSYTDEMCLEMKKLLPYADVLTPNLTEACRMLDLDYHRVKYSQESLEEISGALSEKGPEKVVITGLQQGEQIFNYIYERNKTSKMIATRKIGGDRSGTGDVFSSIVTGALIQGDDFITAVKRAVQFLDKAIAFTARQELPWNYGICFEEYLKEI